MIDVWNIIHTHTHTHIHTHTRSTRAYSDCRQKSISQQWLEAKCWTKVDYFALTCIVLGIHNKIHCSDYSSNYKRFHRELFRFINNNITIETRQRLSVIGVNWTNVLYQQACITEFFVNIYINTQKKTLLLVLEYHIFTYISWISLIQCVLRKRLFFKKFVIWIISWTIRWKYAFNTKLENQLHNEFKIM